MDPFFAFIDTVESDITQISDINDLFDACLNQILEKDSLVAGEHVSQDNAQLQQLSADIDFYGIQLLFIISNKRY